MFAMSDTYKDLFKERANKYHYAMTRYPKAREEEFLALFKGLRPICVEDKIADLPAGGGYLREYLPQNITVYQIDPCKEFRVIDSAEYIVCDMHDIPVSSGFFNGIFSLAGLHHTKDKHLVYKEVGRVLKYRGDFVLADVLSGSKEDYFLNTFVHQTNSMGHVGDFLDANLSKDLSNIGLTVKSISYEENKWCFSNEVEMIDFVKNLFGIDLIDDNQILRALQNILGYEISEGLIKLNWGLLYTHSIKNAA
jgi:SAM-dependent methyltransferase